jgi:predicted PhzF superfamily epimerase YddE/YHI9
MSAAFDPGDVQLREATADERDLALHALGRNPDILAAEICVASIGRPRLLVPISTPSALAALHPDYGLPQQARHRHRHRTQDRVGSSDPRRRRRQSHHDAAAYRPRRHAAPITDDSSREE